MLGMSVLLPVTVGSARLRETPISDMTRKRLIASLLLVVLSVVQVAAWALAFERLDQASGRQGLAQSVEALLTIVPEPLLIALAGCLLIVIGVGVGMIGRKPAARPTERILPLA